MTPEIIRLLELSPDASPKQVRKAYRKRRREIDPQNTGELERLDAAYAEAMKQKRSAGYSDEQFSAMRFLGIVPGCSLKTAIKFARNNGLDETEIQTAAGILEPVMPKVSVKDIALAVLRAVLAWLPVLLARPLYLMIQKSGVNLFPGHSDPELAEWFSGTLTASVTVSVLFTVTVPLLFISFLRRMGERKRTYRRLEVTPAVPLMNRDIFADLDMIFLCIAVVIALNGPRFYQNAFDYPVDYTAMKSESYLSVHTLAPDYTSDYNKHDIMGSLVSVGEDLVLDARDELYDDGTPGSENGYVHEATYHYLPRTKLVHHVDVDCWRMAEWGERTDEQHLQSIQPLYRLLDLHTETEEDLIYYHYLRSAIENTGSFENEKRYIWYDEQQDKMFALISYTGDSIAENEVAAIVLDKDGNILQKHTLPGMQVGKVFLLDNSDVILFARTTLQDPENFGASFQAVIHLDGSDLSRIAQSESQRVSPYDEVDFGKVGTDGIDATFKTTVYGGGTKTVKEEHRFFSIP